MKKLLILLLLTLCITSCSKPAVGDGLNVYTTTYTLFDFATKLANDMVLIKYVLPPGAEPHDWEPSAKDLTVLAQSDLLIINGLGMEHWLEKVSQSITIKNTIVTSQNINILESNNNYSDPHVWLNPQNAKLQMEAIKDALVKEDSSNAQAYEERFLHYAEMFDALDKKFEQQLEKCNKKTIVVTHAAFSHLCERYGLTQLAIEGASADSEPDPATMASIVEYIKQNNIKYIFVESGGSDKTADTIANETGISTLPLNALEIQPEDSADYFETMEQNLQNLVKALE